MCHPRSPTTVHQRMLLPGTRILCRSCILLGLLHLAALLKKVQLRPSIQQINPKWLQLHSLARSLMSSTRWVSAVPPTAMPAHMGHHQGHHLALRSSRSSQGLSTNSPIQGGYHQHRAPCHRLGCHELAWVWKHTGKVYKKQIISNKSTEATLLLLET